jgi:hypothetical protein
MAEERRIPHGVLLELALDALKESRGHDREHV